MNKPIHRSFARPLSALRLLALTATVAVAATAAQTALAMPGGHGGPGGPGMGMMFAGPGMDRMLDRVNASAEQKAQVRQIAQAAMADMRTLREGGRKLREQGAELFTQPTVDARAAEALRQQMLAQHDQTSRRMMQAMLDVSRVLSPEQRKQMAELMKQRGAMMERHRSEREQLEGAPRRN